MQDARRIVRLLLVAAMVAVLIGVASSDARADGIVTGAPPGKVEWKDGKWDRFTPAEGALVTLITVGSFTLDHRLPDPMNPGADFEVPLLDPGVRGLVRARSVQGQETWSTWSDIGYRSMALFPMVVDAGAVALGIHRNVDVAAQLFLIDLESFTVAAFAQQMTSRLVSRPRPYRQDCADDNQSTRHTCGDLRDVRSFYAGHPSAAFTAAGLTCLHHEHMPLWGGGAPDAWACVWSISFASLTAIGRIAADEHYASDVVVGVGTGWLFGYLMPKWLHYGTRGERPVSLVGRLFPSSMRDGGLVLAPTFAAYGDGGILGVRGTL